MPGTSRSWERNALQGCKTLPSSGAIGGAGILSSLPQAGAGGSRNLPEAKRRFSVRSLSWGNSHSTKKAQEQEQNQWTVNLPSIEPG